jgi:fumarate reductase subunit D
MFVAEDVALRVVTFVRVGLITVFILVPLIDPIFRKVNKIHTLKSSTHFT